MSLNELPISSVKAGNRLRISDNNLAELQSSLVAKGQLCPIRVRRNPVEKESYEVIFGNRRLAAAKDLGWKTIRAEIVDVSDADALVEAFRENTDREDLSDYERALALESIHNRIGKSYVDLAKIIGKSTAFVYQHIAMLHLFPESIASSDEIRKVLCSISERHARVLAGVEDVSRRWEIAKLTISSKLGVRELEKLSRKRKEPTRNDFHRNQTEIREAIATAMDGFCSSDISKFFSKVSKKNFTMFASFPPFKILDTEEAIDQTCRFIRAFSPCSSEIKNLQVNVKGDIAYATLVLNRKISLVHHNTIYCARGTIVLEKEDGEWKIVHAHWSSANETEPLNPIRITKSQKH